MYRIIDVLVIKELLDKEILFQSDLEGLIGKRPFEKETTYQAYTNSSNGKAKKEAEAAEKESVEEAAETKEQTSPDDSPPKEES